MEYQVSGQAAGAAVATPQHAFRNAFNPNRFFADRDNALSARV